MDVEDKSGINGAWEGYRAGQDKYSATNELRLNALLAAMTSYAVGVVWKEMRDRRPDIVNDCLLRALRGLPRFREESKFSTWFHRIVVNRCRTVQRVEGRRKKIEIQPEVDWDCVAPNIHTTVAEYMDYLRGHSTPGYDDADFFFRKVVQGFNDFELGARFNLAPGGVRSRWRRIKEKLRREI